MGYWEAQAQGDLVGYDTGIDGSIDCMHRCCVWLLDYMYLYVPDFVRHGTPLFKVGRFDLAQCISQKS